MGYILETMMNIFLAFVRSLNKENILYSYIAMLTNQWSESNRLSWGVIMLSTGVLKYQFSVKTGLGLNMLITCYITCYNQTRYLVVHFRLNLLVKQREIVWVLSRLRFMVGHSTDVTAIKPKYRARSIFAWFDFKKRKNSALSANNNSVNRRPISMRIISMLVLFQRSLQDVNWSYLIAVLL